MSQVLYASPLPELIWRKTNFCFSLRITGDFLCSKLNIYSRLVARNVHIMDSRILWLNQLFIMAYAFINNQCIPVLCKCIVHFAIPSVWMRLTNQSIIHRVLMSCPCLSNHPCSDHHSPDRHQCCRGRGASTTISSSSFQHFLTFSSHPLRFVCPSRTHFAWGGWIYVCLAPKQS